MQTINQAYARMDGVYNTLRAKCIKLTHSPFAFVWVGIVFLCHSAFCSNPTQVDHKNKQCSKLTDFISTDERQELALFFYDLFAHEELGYTLFGDKPMSFCFPMTYPPTFSNIKPYRFRLYIEGTIPFVKGLAAWNKLKTMGCNKDYSLIIYEEQKYPSLVLLINKRSFLDILNKNIDVVQEIFGNSVSAISFLKDLEEKKIKPDELFQHHLLLGIILGYGRHSAELFDRHWYLTSNEIDPPFLQYQKKASKGFSSVDEELHSLTERLQAESKTFEWYTNTFELCLRVTTVPFAFDTNDPEADALIKKYKKLHAQLTAIFDREDWLEVILQKLLAKQGSEKFSVH